MATGSPSQRVARHINLAVWGPSRVALARHYASGGVLSENNILGDEQLFAASKRLGSCRAGLNYREGAVLLRKDLLGDVFFDLSPARI